MPQISVMLKPASGLCNLRCKYCFYADETANRETPSYGIMSVDVLEAVIRRILSFAEGSCTIAFQGGEPTLAGLDFFKQAVEFEKRWNINHVEIHNAFQTNGILLDENWASFFAENRFLVGISLDGPKDINDMNRLDSELKSTFSRVLRTVHLLESRRVDFNILTVVTAATCKSVRKIYGFFNKNHLDYQQYIPCLDPLGEERGNHSYSLTPDGYEKFLKDLFDCWYQDVLKGRPRYNRYFENLLMIISGQPPEACGMNGICGHQYVVEADGSVYPCDFYMLDEWTLGNFVIDDFDKIEKRRAELNFLQMSAQEHTECVTCKWKSLCRGGCRRDREPFIDGKTGKNYFCKAYYNFFEYAFPRLQQALIRFREEETKSLMR